MTSQTGGSKNAGGKTVDAWADFRFMQEGQSPLWDVVERDHWWVLILSGPREYGMVDLKNMERVSIRVMPSERDTNLAIDASLEFLDRLWERRVPKFIDSPDALMSFCVKAAIRQG